MDLKALWNRYKEGSKAIDDLKTAMTVTKNDKKEFTIDGQSENCRGYHVTLPERWRFALQRRRENFS